ncbi:MAG: hypothetical protein LBJ00_08075, partial [Planctomycetaceae bacterium]|nr:hypothetical protein [Planctomycetaceae bacterium]
MLKIVIPKPAWAVGFALEQPLSDATLACSASGILKQLEYIFRDKKDKRDIGDKKGLGSVDTSLDIFYYKRYSLPCNGHTNTTNRLNTCFRSNGA